MSRDRIACPCGSGRLYPACCARWHMGSFKLRAPDAETLMRSRFSAYVMDDLTYLRDTWAPETRPEKIEPNPDNLKWLGLQVKQVENIDDTHANVTFVARYRLSGRGMRMQETSRFRQERGRWFYIDGDVKEG